MSNPMVAPNGLNLSRSVKNPNSNLNKVRNYLAREGTATRLEILRDVFGRTCRGWGCYLFAIAIRQGFITKTRKGNAVFYANNNV